MKNTAAVPSPKTGKNTALLIIDVQRGLFRKSTPVYQAEQLLTNINLLADRARQAGSPVVFIQHAAERSLVEGSEDWQLHPQVQPVHGDLLVHKRQGNAFASTALEGELEAREVGTLIVTGLVTHGCVRATCAGGKELGYRVILVADGHSSYHRQAAQLIAEWNQKLSEGIVELRTAAEIDFAEQILASRLA
jgi:nicotinamidase-related amidase